MAEQIKTDSSIDSVKESIKQAIRTRDRLHSTHGSLKNVNGRLDVIGKALNIDLKKEVKLLMERAERESRK